MKTQGLGTVKKFGGTSLGTLERIEWVADRLALEYQEGIRPIVVASAMAGETNRLIGLGSQVHPGYRGPAYDMLLATGEQVVISLLSMALEKRRIPSRPLLAHQIGIQTDEMFSKARIKNITTGRLSSLVESGIVPVIAGFQGVGDDDHLTTLGRGGSDTTAVALAAALSHRECEIYTDVIGVYTADPRLVPNARLIRSLSFEEMIEMASLGSKVLAIRSVEIAAKFGVNIHVRSSFEWVPGTLVRGENEIMEQVMVSGITHEAATAVLRLYQIPAGTQALADIFKALASKGVVVDIITQGYLDNQQRLAFSVPLDEAALAEETVLKVLPSARCEVLKDVAKVSAVGVGMRNHPGVAAAFFEVLAARKIEVLLVTTSEIKVSAIVPSDKYEAAARALHDHFELHEESGG